MKYSWSRLDHYIVVIMGAMTSQNNGVSIIHLTVWSGADQIKNQGFASLAFVRGIHRRPVDSTLNFSTLW